MVKIQPCRRHGVCNRCGRTQEKTEIWEIKTSVVVPGWTTAMLCRECLLSFFEDLEGSYMG